MVDYLYNLSYKSEKWKDKDKWISSLAIKKNEDNSNDIKNNWEKRLNLK